MLPVSQYEALLAEVRGLRRKAQRVQQLATPLISNLPGSSYEIICEQQIKPYEFNNVNSQPLNSTMESVIVGMQHSTTSYYDGVVNNCVESDTTCSEDECGARSTHMSVSSEPISHENRGNLSSLYHGTWPVEKTMWNSEPTNLRSSSTNSDQQTGMASVMSFASSSGGVPLDRVFGSADRSQKSSQQLEAKVDMVYSLLSMLGSQEHADMGETLLALSGSPESCLAMRQSGCMPLLVQLVQSDRDTDTRKKASQALQNLINCQLDDKLKKREIRIFKLLEHARLYIEALRTNTELEIDISSSSEDNDPHPVQTIAHLMKLSFDEEHRQAICHLGGIHVIASLVEAEHSIHGSTTDEAHCVLMRRYACMALTNLTFGDSGNKALLCSLREFMRALVVQLQSPCDELRQVTASVLRNLSWRADTVSKEILREVGTVTGLMKAAMINNKENTLKSILSALWNLSAHCTENKSEICAIENALAFLVGMLTYKTPSKSLAVIENSGGILRNISSQIAVRDDYREILRKHNCLQILLDQLKSPSLTIVSNACGTLWNLSAKCAVDQDLLWQMGAPAMLRSLNNSKHKMIAMGSSAALKNLLSSRPTHGLLSQMDSTARAMDLPVLPTLRARKQKSLMQELDQTLSETFENIDKDSPTKSLEDENQMFERADKYIASNDHLLRSFKNKRFTRSESEECVSQKEHLYESRTCRSDTSIRSNICNSEHVNYVYNGLKSIIDTPVEKSARVSKIPQYGGSTSLPYSTTTTKYSKQSSTLIPMKSKYSSMENVPDVRKQCSEKKHKPNKVAKGNWSSNRNESHSVRKGNLSSQVGVMAEKQSFSSDYETDVYQPTDYSLKYFEKDLDLVKDKGLESGLNLNETYTKINVFDKEAERFSQKDDEKDHCSVEDISDLENQSKVFYKNNDNFDAPNYKPFDNTFVKLDHRDAKKLAYSEDKVLKLEEAVNYAEETPLMFSRSSSLASLESMEHLVDDDRNSVVSDFSRLTSGVVTPSEFPNSPTHMVPPSPKPRKKDSLELQSRFQSSELTASRPQPAPRAIQKPSVFEDSVTKFKVEGTPVHFSAATTSLSNLSIDDRKVQCDVQDVVQTSHYEIKYTVEENTAEKKDIEKEKQNDYYLCGALSEDEGDEDMLAACISIGMQNNRHSINKQSRMSNKTSSDNLRNSSEHSGIPLPKSGKLSKSIPSLLPKTIKSGVEKNIQHSLVDIDKNKEHQINNTTTIKNDTKLFSRKNDSESSFSIQTDIHNTSVALQNEDDTRKDSASSVIEDQFDCDKETNEKSLLSGTNKYVTLDSSKVVSTKKPIGIATKQFCIKNVFKSNEIDKEKIHCLNDTGIFEKKIDTITIIKSTSDKHDDQSFNKPTKLEYDNIVRDDFDNKTSVEMLTCSDSDNCISLEVETNSVTGLVDNRMLDPDAMIESLDRFTAELVSQASSHLQNKDEAKYTTSTTDGSTWNEEMSQNDISFPSISGSVPNIITFKSESDAIVANILNDIEDVDNVNKEEEKSNDFSSLNTTSTLTESTLIAMEATKMATAFKNEADMSASLTSASSLELDNVQPPSQLNLLVSSVENQIPKKSFKLISRKKSLPSGIMFRKALSNSFNQASSLESLENRSLSNLDQMNPPSLMAELLDVADMEGSMSSVASLTSEIADVKADFAVNNIVSKSFDKVSQPNPIFTVKQPGYFLADCSSANSITDLENINPPSLFHEITDMCNSLADVTTEAIGSETEIFEDCYTHVIDTTLKTENDDNTEFSDANSVTPIQTDQSSSSESTPKKNKNLKRHLTPKQRRNLAKERYKTYTVAAEMVMREEEQKLKSTETAYNADTMSSSTTEDFKTCNNVTESKIESKLSQNMTASKLTAKERRQNDRSRFETQILDSEVVTFALNKTDCDIPPPFKSDNSACSSTEINDTSQKSERSINNIRQSFIQKRMENRDRFKTHTLKESSLTPEISGSPIHNSENPFDLHYLVQKEANLVLKTLKETKSTDEFLDYETLSLVSNEDDSEHNSGSSIHYRTYHKSWGVRGKNIPVVQSTNLSSSEKDSDPKNCITSNLINDQSETVLEGSNGILTENKCISKPKIVKPTEKSARSDSVNCDEEIQGKGIKGRRKPLYSKTNLMKTPPKTIKPIRNMTSNLVNNVSSSFRTTAGVKPAVGKPKTQNQNRALKPPSGNSKLLKTNMPMPKTINITKPISLNQTISTKNTSRIPQQLERQGTFTKEDKDTTTCKSRIPMSGNTVVKSASLSSRIAKPVTPSKTTNLVQKNASSRNGFVKSASSDRGSKVCSSPVRFYRSPSADSKENITNRIQGSLSSQSLKSDSSKNQGATKRLSTPNSSTRSDSNSSLGCTSPNPRKQITSKIASLWSKIEESKKQMPKKDNKIWITSNSATNSIPAKLTLVRSNTFGSESGITSKREQNKSSSPKHISRLGSTIKVDKNNIYQNESR